MLPVPWLMDWQEAALHFSGAREMVFTADGQLSTLILSWPATTAPCWAWVTVVVLDTVEHPVAAARATAMAASFRELRVMFMFFSIEMS
ncbi:hypothetical protein D3C78_1402140 [compost metagenome]